MRYFTPDILKVLKCRINITVLWIFSQLYHHYIFRIIFFFAVVEVKILEKNYWIVSKDNDMILLTRNDPDNKYGRLEVRECRDLLEFTNWSNGHHNSQDLSFFEYFWFWRRNWQKSHTAWTLNPVTSNMNVNGEVFTL